MRSSGRTHLPLGIKLSYGLGTPFVRVVYARAYGPQNFLWLSDIALGLTTAAVITESRLAASMAAVGVLPLELAWNIDFAARGKLMGLAAYMFDSKLPAGLRALSLFHVALPPTLIWLLQKSGYNRRAFAIQCGVTWIALTLSYALTDPQQNINWVFGPGSKPQRRLPALLYLVLVMVGFPVLAHWPTHLGARPGNGWTARWVAPDEARWRLLTSMPQAWRGCARCKSSPTRWRPSESREGGVAGSLWPV